MHKEIVGKLVDELVKTPVRIFNNSSDLDLVRYVKDCEKTYIRTIKDVDSIFKNRHASAKIIELGSFLGIVSIALKKLGYDITACDIPEFHASEELQSFYNRNAVPFKPINLRHRSLPFADGELDAVIMCETLEHLNFNPIPALMEINRVLKKDGIFYVGMPNQSHILQRIKLLFGNSIHNSIDEMFQQMTPSTSSAGIHWREYTMSETTELLARLGFKCVRKYYYTAFGHTTFIKALIKRAMYTIPSFRPALVVVAKKIDPVQLNLYFSEINT